MKKLKKWQFVLLIIFYPVGIIYFIVWLCKGGKRFDSYTDDFYILRSNPSWKKHFEYMEKIDALYKVANSTDDKFTPKMEECISLCKKDIELAKILRDLCIKFKEPVFAYPSFKRLAIIYDKRGQYKEAINACTQSLVLGYDDAGDMYSRLARLLKKDNGDTIESHLEKHEIKM